MNQCIFIPGDSMTQGILIDVLTEMYKHAAANINAVATSEFARPDAATADTESAEADISLEITTDTESGQSEDEE